MKRKKITKIFIVLLFVFLFFPSHIVLAAKTYTVTLDQDGGTGGQTTVTGVTKNKAMPELTSLPTRLQFGFGGYYSSKDCKGTQYYSSAGKSKHKYDQSKNITIYACWNFDKDTPVDDPSATTPSGDTLDDYYNKLIGYENPDGRLSFTESTPIDLSGSNSADPLTGGYGIYIKLIQYDSKTKTETVVGTPILIYSGKLLDGIVSKQPPKSGSSMISSGNTKICFGPECTDEFCRQNNLVRVDLWDYIGSKILSKTTYDGGLSTPIDWKDKIKQLFTLDWKNLGSGWKYVYDATELIDAELGLINTNCLKTGQKSFYENVYYYDSDDISYATGSSSASTPTIIRHNDLKNVSLYDYIINCLANSSCNLNGLSAPITKEKIKTAFKLRDGEFNERLMDTYYLSFEPVVRDTIGENTGKYKQRIRTTTSVSGYESWYYHCNASSYDGCQTGDIALRHDYFGHTGDIGRYKCTTYTHKTRVCGACDNSHTRECTKSDGTKGCYHYDETTDCYSRNLANQYDEDSNKRSWKAKGCATYKTTIYNRLTTIENHYYTQIVAARSISLGNAMLNDLVTAENHNETGSLTRHINEETLAEEHYVGPELETAITGQCGKLGSSPSSECKAQNKYSLYHQNIKNEDGSNFEFKKGNAAKAAIGVLYLWYPEITGCSTECENTSGENRLKCAENFCDNLYYYEEGSTSATQKNKAACLVSCGFPKTANNCESKLNDINFIRDIMNEAPTSVLSDASQTFTSTCNLNSSNGVSDDDKGYTRYCLMDTTDTDVLDQIQFVNVMCVESTSCGFSDISDERITKGRRIDYNSRTHIKKKCKVWFDIDSWKFYYASVPRGDEFGLPELGSDGKLKVNVYNTRERMLAMIDWYNDAAKRGFDEAISQNIVKEGSTITWEKLDYDISNLKVHTIINENYIGGSGKLREENDLVENKDSVDSELNNVTNSTSIEDSKPNTDTSKIRNNAHSYQRYDTVEKHTNTYATSSSYDATYELPKMYCLSQDSDATPVPTDNKMCDEKTLAVHAYFLNLHSTGVDFTTNCSNRKNSKTTVKYYESQDDCPSTTYANTSCQIIVRGTQQCDQYSGPVDIMMYMTINNTVDVHLEDFGLAIGSVTYNKVDVISNYDPNPGGTVTVYGVLKMSDGSVSHCQKTITVNECTLNGCKVSKDDTYSGTGRVRYYVTLPNGTTGPGTYYAKTTNSSSGFLKLGLENGKHVFYPTLANDGVSGKLATEYDVIGKIVEGSTCKLCCNKPPVEPGKCNQDLKAVKKYCSESYNIDPHQFESEDECIAYYNSSCCPTYATAAGKYEELEEWCSDENNLADNEFPSTKVCINKCCQDQDKCMVSDNITYRPVSRENPFPNSDISKRLGYQEGNRVVGRNWAGQYENITTTESKNPSVYDETEYVITLTPSRIREIRTDNEKHSTVYYDFIDARETDPKEQAALGMNTSGCNTEEVSGYTYTGYCSKFVHATKYFEIVRGDPNSNYIADE